MIVIVLQNMTIQEVQGASFSTTEKAHVINVSVCRIYIFVFYIFVYDILTRVIEQSHLELTCFFLKELKWLLKGK